METYRIEYDSVLLASAPHTLRLISSFVSCQTHPTHKGLPRSLDVTDTLDS